METPNNFSTSNIDSEIKNICNRCRVEMGEFICSECSPFNIFCLNCDNYIHSLPSKRNHSRVPFKNSINSNIINSTTQDETLNNFINQSNYLDKNINNLNNNHFNNNINSNQTILFSSGNQIQNNNINNNNNLMDNNNNNNKYTQNYMNEIKQIYENEKEELLNKNYLLQKEMKDMERNYLSQIENLKNIIEQLNIKLEKDKKNLIENNEIEIKRIIAEKENQISYLYNQNFELQKANDVLLQKNNKFNDILTNDKVNYNSQISDYKNTIQGLQRDNNDLKEFYDNKLNFFTKNFSLKKNKIIDSYENTIEKLSNGYNESKEKYLNVINQRDNEIKNLIQQHRNETDKLNFNLKELKTQIEVLREEQEKLLKINAEQKKDNDLLSESLERAKKEITFHIREKNQILEDSKSIQYSYNELKAENAKINRLTHGKLKKNKSVDKKK